MTGTIYHSTIGAVPGAKICGTQYPEGMCQEPSEQENGPLEKENYEKYGGNVAMKH